VVDPENISPENLPRSPHERTGTDFPCRAQRRLQWHKLPPIFSWYPAPFGQFAGNTTVSAYGITFANSLVASHSVALSGKKERTILMRYLNLRTLAAAVGVLGCAGVVAVNSARADQWNKKTILTVNEPIQVRDTLLEPGQYVFKLLDSPSNRNIVQIYNSDQTHLIDTVLAIPNYRIQPTGKSRFTFWETPPGSAKALRAWFYPGDNFGQEFTYPKHLIQLASTTTTTQTTVAEPPPPPPAEPPAEQPQASVQEPAPNPPAEIAQNEPPPPPPAPEAQPAPAPEPAPQTLPKTGSRYPLFGLGGLLSLGLYGLIRIKRTA
jgi:LPXTG-motif cell wall-anchored protein